MKNYILVFTHNMDISKIAIYLEDNMKINRI
jgi:hypothetical protein